MEIESINTGNSSYDKIRHKDSPQQNTQRSQSADEDFDKPDDLENDDLDQVSPKSKDRTQTSRTPSGMIKTDTGYIKDPNASDPNLPYEDFYGKDKQDVYSSTAGSLRNNGAPLYSDPIAAREALKEQYNRAKGITGEKTTEADLQQQQQFLETAQSVDSEGNVTMDPRVAAMLEMGMFKDNDSQGKSLVENLNALKNQQFHSGIDGNQVYQDVLATLSNPESINMGESKETCPATVAQYKLALENPAEYVRLVSGLTEQNGMTQMRNGDSLALNQTALSEDGSGRRLTDRLFQASLMEYGKDDYDYDNVTDKHYPNPNLGSGTDTKTGLNIPDFTKVLNSLLDTQTEFAEVKPRTKMTDLEADLKNSLKNSDSVPVVLSWSDKADGKHGYHTLTMAGMTDDKIILRNPYGQTDDGLHGLEREFLKDSNGQHNGMIAIDKVLFYDKLQYYAKTKNETDPSENLH